MAGDVDDEVDADGRVDGDTVDVDGEVDVDG